MLVNHTSAEIATQRLREAILRGDLRPGSKLHQDQLAETLQVSRTPLRTALASLSQAGLVAYESNRGFRVREFSYADMIGAFEVRAELEATACRLAARHVTPEILLELNSLVAEGERALEPGELLPENLVPYRQMNVRFHESLMKAAGNPWIREFVDRLHNVPMASDRIIMWQDFNVISRSHDDHHRIVNALARGEGERAAAIMREHIIFSLEHLLDQLGVQREDYVQMSTTLRSEVNGPERRPRKKRGK